MCGTEGKGSRMSDDLISRRALLEAIDISFIIPILEINMREKHKAVLKIREIIVNMPTAFNKEKVIKKLEEAGQECNEANDICGAEAIDYAIGVVEEGGVE